MRLVEQQQDPESNGRPSKNHGGQPKGVQSYLSKHISQVVRAPIFFNFSTASGMPAAALTLHAWVVISLRYFVSRLPGVLQRLI